MEDYYRIPFVKMKQCKNHILHFLKHLKDGKMLNIIEKKELSVGKSSCLLRISLIKKVTNKCHYNMYTSSKWHLLQYYKMYILTITLYELMNIILNWKLDGFLLSKWRAVPFSSPYNQINHVSLLCCKSNRK